MGELTITRGLPASGKTMFAREKVRLREVTRAWEAGLAPPCVRVNRDDLRAMLHVGDWSAEQEEATKIARDAIIDMLLWCGYDVVCDDTHLRAEEVAEMHRLAKERDATFTIEDLRHVPVAECIARDAERERPVGRDVIERLARRGGHLP